MMFKKTLAATAVMIASMAGSAQAASVSETFDIFITGVNPGDVNGFNGQLLGSISVTYDDDFIATGDTSDISSGALPLVSTDPTGGIIIPGLPPITVPTFTFSLTADLLSPTQVFTNPDDVDAELHYNSGDLTGISLAIGNVGTSPVTINDPRVDNFATFGTASFFDLASTSASGATQGFNVSIADVSVSVVPLPASSLLLASGLLGTGLIARRRRRKS